MSSPSNRFPYVLLETRKRDGDNRRSFLFDRPVACLTLHAGDDVDAFFARLDAALQSGLWAAGYFAYEFGYLLEPKLHGLLRRKTPPGPLAWLGLFRRPGVVEAGRVPQPGIPGTPGVLASPGTPYAIRDFAAGVRRDAYGRTIARIQDGIRRGDTYQVNFTFKCRFTLDGTAESLYAGMRERQSASYCACLCDGRRSIVSLSPELFFCKRGRRIRARPMKGTVRRGRTPAEDEELARWLAADAKNRAENVMIVDMIRNDLGRLATPGGVRVPRLLEVERYETLFQMTSTIEATLPPEVSWREIMRSVYPCASVTGAPKVRTMEIIADLEPEPRGVYTGAIGYIAPDGEACFSVAIRTITVEPDGRCEMGIGSGIVNDSEPAAEYEECLLKAKFLRERPPAFSIVETMRLENGSIRRAGVHLNRMEASARYFDFAFPRDRVQAALRTLATRKPGGCFKARLLLDRNGRFRLTAEPLTPDRPAVRRLKLSTTRTSSADRFLYHKTTHRPLYARERERARAEGFDEVIFRNERNEITEGAVSNVFVERGGVLYTPPRSSGLLPGTCRRSLLDSGRCRERVLHLEDLSKADRIYVGNAIDGLAPAVLPAPDRTSLTAAPAASRSPGP